MKNFLLVTVLAAVGAGTAFANHEAGAQPTRLARNRQGKSKLRPPARRPARAPA